MSNEIDLKKLSEIELKALVYDELVKIEQWQNNIRNSQATIKVINEEIKIKSIES